MFSGLFAKRMPGGRVRLKHPVYFVRHGETDWNRERRYQGLSDIPLNDRGREQAARNGETIAADIANPTGYAFFTSPLSRASETLEIIRERMGLPRRRYAIDDRLIEIDLGEWNGRTVDEVHDERPDQWEGRQASKWDFVIPGGESYRDAAARVRDFLTALSGPAIIVGHGASGRLLRAYLTGERREKVAHLAAPQDVVFRIERGRETVL